MFPPQERPSPTIGDLSSIDHAHHDQFVTVVPPHTSPPALSPAYGISYKQSHPSDPYLDHHNQYNHNFYLGSEASSPEARVSLSSSSTGSYSLPRVNLDPVQSYPVQSYTEKFAGSARAAWVLASRAEEGPASNGAVATADGSAPKDGYSRSSWTGGQMSLSEGQSPRSIYHDGQNSVVVYSGTKEQSASSRHPNAVLALILLSMPIPLFSLGTALYTLFALFFVVLSSPLRLCAPTAFFRSTSFSLQLCQLLVPALRYHERLAQSHHHNHHHHHHHHPYRPSASSSLTDMFSPTWLVFVLILAPVLTLGLLLAVWTAAFFWIFAMILGNPDGTERRDDGRAAVLGVNGWWQKWLGKSRRRR